MDHHVGTEQTALRSGRLLLVEVDVRQHSRRLDGPAQGHFAPTTPGLRRAQRRHQVVRFLLQAIVTVTERGDTLIEGGVRVLTLPLHVLDATFVAGQGLAEWVQQLLDRLLALRQVSLRRGAAPGRTGCLPGRETAGWCGPTPLRTNARTCPRACAARPRPAPPPLLRGHAAPAAHWPGRPAVSRHRGRQRSRWPDAAVVGRQRPAPRSSVAVHRPDDRRRHGPHPTPGPSARRPTRGRWQARPPTR